MKIVVFGLTVSSSWGNGHATLWRGLIRALVHLKHRVVFFERNTPYYAAHRDLDDLGHGQLMLYESWDIVSPRARRAMADADTIIITSYCPDALRALRLVRDAAPGALLVFYDLDTPVTLARLAAGETVNYLPPEGLGDFDLVLSYTGGRALSALRQLGAARTAALYGHADPQVHAPLTVAARTHLSYLGTYAADRQPVLQELFIEPARRRPDRTFLIGGAAYPHDFPWQPNIAFVGHVAPGDHAAFFCASHLTLSVTRASMRAMGYCPSGRLFEAAACETVVLSDRWEGLANFFTPDEEILLASSTAEVMTLLDKPDTELRRIARAARERVLAEHTSMHRAMELVILLEETHSAGAREHSGVSHRHAS
ncbi:MAG: glycosyltransferase [Sinobacteraceae bacterium]|nr:glycosyltransferase [Nevskiaceae bacterium]